MKSALGIYHSTMLNEQIGHYISWSTYSNNNLLTVDK